MDAANPAVKVAEKFLMRGEKMARAKWKGWTWLRKTANRILNPEERVAPLPICQESSFWRTLIQERKRALRSQKPLVIVILDARKAAYDGDDLPKLLSEGLSACVRRTDICGMLWEHMQMGIILTEMEPEKVERAKAVMAEKIRVQLGSLLSQEVVERISIQFRVLEPAAVAAMNLTGDGEVLEGAAAEKDGAARLWFETDQEEMNLRRLARFLQEQSAVRQEPPGRQ